MFFTPEDQAGGRPARGLEQARRTGRVEDEGWRRRKDGSRFWALVVMDAIRDETGTLIGFAKVTRDMTERRAAQKRWRRASADFASWSTASSTTRSSCSIRRAATQLEQRPERIKGYAADEIVGEHFSRFYTEEDRRSGVPTRALEQAAAEGRFATEGWRVRRDGSRFWATVVIDAIRGEDGSLIGFAKVTRDITEQRDAQRRLEETREQLFQSQKMEAIGQLTGGIAHDFNNLLTIILGGADMAERLVGDNEKLKRILGNVRHAVKRGETLTKQLPAFSRRQTLKPQVIDLHEQLAIVTDLLSRALRGDIAIATDVAPDVSLIEVDASQLELRT